VTASYLETSRVHEVHLTQPHFDQLLKTRTPTTPTFTFRATLPSVAIGTYEIVLLEKTLFGTSEEIGREPISVTPTPLLRDVIDPVFGDGFESL